MTSILLLDDYIILCCKYTSLTPHHILLLEKLKPSKTTTVKNGTYNTASRAVQCSRAGLLYLNVRLLEFQKYGIDNVTVNIFRIIFPNEVCIDNPCVVFEWGVNFLAAYFWHLPILSVFHECDFACYSNRFNNNE